jgi:hypothetical protein
MKPDDKISELLGSHHEQQLEAFKEMLKGGDLRKVPIQVIIRVSPFLEEWMEFAMSMTDAPDEFLAAGGLQLIASVLGNQTYISFGNDKIFPHLWVVLLAPSSFFHKTTALNLVKRTISSLILSRNWQDRQTDVEKLKSTEQKINDEVKVSGIRSGQDMLAPDRFSIDLLLEELENRPSMLLVQSEYGAFLKEIDKTFNLGAKETLTEIYDSGLITKFNKTIKAQNDGKPIRIDNTALSIFSASTKDWLEEYIKLSDLGAGFIARFLFVPASKKTRFIGWPATRDEETYERIKQNLLKIRKSMKGELDVSAIKPFYELWYMDLFDRVHREETVTKTIGFDQRLAIYALKFTTILHASTYGNTIITLDSLIRGIQLAEYFRDKTQELFETTFLPKFDQDVRKMAEFIYRHDHKKTKRQLHQRAGAIGIRGEAFKQILELLEEDGDVHWDANEKATISQASKYLKGVIKK